MAGLRPNREQRIFFGLLQIDATRIRDNPIQWRGTVALWSRPLRFLPPR